MIRTRPEKQTDPNKLPGQVVTPPKYLKDVIKRIQEQENEVPKKQG